MTKVNIKWYVTKVNIKKKYRKIFTNQFLSNLTSINLYIKKKTKFSKLIPSFFF